MTTLTAPTDRATILRPAAHTLFALLVAAQIAIVIFSLWEPPFDGTIRYDDIAPISDSYWPMNLLLGGPAYAVHAVTASLFLVVLGSQGRRGVLTLAATVVHLLAGLVFALVITAEVLPFAWAADPSVMNETDGRALFALYNEQLDGFLPYVIVPMAVIALSALLALAGTTLPRWVPVAALAIIAGLFALPLGNPFTVVADVAQRVLWIYIGWCGLRALLERA